MPNHQEHHNRRNGHIASGSPDGPPSPQYVSMPPWPAVLVDCSGGQPVLIDGELIPSPEPIDARCPGCRANQRLLFDVDDPALKGIIAVLVLHQDGCQALADRLELKRRAS